ncbi:MAG: hypothetical protein ACI8XO_002340 [Verrucomicrobiales bacterium]|jgi:hypothetical protein
MFTGNIAELRVYHGQLTVPEIDLIEGELVAIYDGGGGLFAITEINHSADDTMVTLTWDSKPDERYTVSYSRDLINWIGDLDDGVDADAGDSTTETFNLAFAGLGGDARIFFRVVKLPAE